MQSTSIAESIVNENEMEDKLFASVSKRSLKHHNWLSFWPILCCPHRQQRRKEMCSELVLITLLEYLHGFALSVRPSQFSSLQAYMTKYSHAGNKQSSARQNASLHHLKDGDCEDPQPDQTVSVVHDNRFNHGRCKAQVSLNQWWTKTKWKTNCLPQ